MQSDDLQFTRDDALLICEAHDIDNLMTDEEELELLADNNPALLSAYQALYHFAHGADEQDDEEALSRG